jgi:hypothetical protein
MSKWMHLRQVVMAAGLVAIIGCSSGPPEWKEVLAAAKPHMVSQAPAQVTNDFVVYLDLSQTMSGYVAKDGRDVYGRSLQELRDVAAALSPTPTLNVRVVSHDVGPVIGDTLLTQAAIDPTLYHGQEADLAGAVGQFAKGIRPGTAIPPARYNVLITSGVQSTSETNSDTSCAAGSNQLCFRKHIHDLLAHGWVGCVVGIRSQFDGIIVSEIDKAARKPDEIHYATTPSDANTYRPFYMYIMCPDAASLDQLMQQLLHRMDNSCGKANLAVFPLGAELTAGAPVVSIDISKNADSPLEIREAPEAVAPCFNVRVPANTVQGKAQTYTAQVKLPWSDLAKACGEANLNSLVGWSLVAVQGPWEGHGDRLPQVIMQPPTMVTGAWSVPLEAFWPQGTGDFGYRVYVLRATVSMRNRMLPWIEMWSTEDDTKPERGNKTLFLQSQLLGLFPDQMVTQVYFRVGRD